MMSSPRILCENLPATFKLLAFMLGWEHDDQGHCAQHQKQLTTTTASKHLHNHLAHICTHSQHFKIDAHLSLLDPHDRCAITPILAKQMMHLMLRYSHNWGLAQHPGQEVEHPIPSVLHQLGLPPVAAQQHRRKQWPIRPLPDGLEGNTPSPYCSRCRQCRIQFNF